MLKAAAHHVISLHQFIKVYIDYSHEAFTQFLDKKVIRVIDNQQKTTWKDILHKNKTNQAYSLNRMSEQQFRSICENNYVDLFYYNTIMHKISDLSLQQKSIIFYHEARAIESEQSYYHQINQIILARHKCIQKVHFVIDQIKQSIAKISQLDRICLLLVHLRMFTLFLIEKIKQWSDYLELKKKESRGLLKYLDNQENILQKISNDTEFLKRTKLKKYVKFGKGFDPLLIRISKRIKKESTMLIVNYEQEDIDRFTLLVQPVVEYLLRLRQAQNALIKYHSLTKQENNIYAPHRNKLAECRSVQMPKIIEQSSPTIQISQQTISLPKISIQQIRQKQRKTRSPGFISKRSERTTNNNKHQMFSKNQISSLDSSTSQQKNRHQKQINSNKHFVSKQKILLSKIQKLKQQLQNDQQKQTSKFVSKFNRKSQPDMRFRKKSILSIMNSLSVSTNKTQKQTGTRKRVSSKGQKFRFLKQIYKDSIEDDLQHSLNIIKRKAVKTIKHMNIDSKQLKFSKYNPEQVHKIKSKSAFFCQ